MAPGSGRSCASTAAVPDVSLIETTLADGTVVREMVCAGLSEHRTGAACSVPEFTKGCVGVQPGPRISLPTCRACIRTKRTTAIEPANNGPRFKPKLPTDQTQTTQEPFTAYHPNRPGLVGSAPQAPRDLAHQRQSRRVTTETGRPENDPQASRLRSWHLARRSGRVSAWPCPPVRSLTILSATLPRNHCRCARSPSQARAHPQSRGRPF